jgi:hypothetical protein
MKMPWTKILLSGDQVKTGEIKRLQAKFREVYNKAGMPTDMAMFAGQPNDKGYYPFYLSPACTRVCAGLTAEYSGVACDKPKKNGIEPTMVIGFKQGWDLLLE